jgi:hypothetical protein
MEQKLHEASSMERKKKNGLLLAGTFWKLVKHFTAQSRIGCHFFSYIPFLKRKNDIIFLLHTLPYKKNQCILYKRSSDQFHLFYG